MTERDYWKRTAEVVEPTTNFGNVLKRFRLAAGLTQEELAGRAGLSARGISDLERGRRSRPYFETVRMLADGLELSDEDRATLLSVARGEEDAPEAIATDDGSSSLPIQLTSFVGRTADCRVLCDLLRRDDVRLVTLTGPGGVGKTRLALEVAADLRPVFPGGVHFVPLAPLHDADLVLTSIAHILGLSDSGSEPMLDRLVAHLVGRRVLLLLDNLEHLLAAVPSVNDLLTRCPGLTVLATSRSPLLLSGEHEFVVTPLASPDPEAANDVATIMQSSAAALLIERLSAIDSGFVLTDVDLSAITEICRRTDGLPLALELAAARARHLTLQELATRLHRRLDLLTRGPRDLPPRQQALRDTIAWSYELLAPEEQRLLRWLAVLTGGWTLERAETLCAGKDGLRIDVIDGLATLVESSLVRLERANDGHSRYGMLDTIREFSEEQLAASGEEEVVRRRLASIMIEYAKEADRGLRSGDRLVWTRAAELDLDNVRSALRWLLDHDEIEQALAFVGNLLWFWDAVGRGREGRSWGEEALAKPNADRQSWAYARASYVTGQQAWAMGDLSVASRLLSASAERFRALGDRGSLGQTLLQLGSAFMSLGDLVTARPIFRESVELLDTAGYRWDYGLAVSMLGDALVATDPGAARRYYEQGLAAFRNLGDQFGMAIPITGLGGLAMRERDYARARALFEEGLTLRRAAGHTFNIAISLASLGELSRYEGDAKRALDYLDEGLSLFRDIGDAERIAWTLYNIGMVGVQTGDAPAAYDALRESLALRVEYGNSTQIAQTIVGLARVALLQGEAKRAARMLGQVDAIRDANEITPSSDEDGEAEARFRQRLEAELGSDVYAEVLAQGRRDSTVTLE